MGAIGVARVPGLSVWTLDPCGCSWTPSGQPPALDSALFPWVKSSVALDPGFSGSNKVTNVLKDKNTTVFWCLERGKFISAILHVAQETQLIRGESVTLGESREPKSPCYPSEIFWDHIEVFPWLSSLPNNTRGHAHTHTHTHLDCRATTHNGGTLTGTSCILVRPVSYTVTIKSAQSWWTHNKEKRGVGWISVSLYESGFSNAGGENSSRSDLRREGDML